MLIHDLYSARMDFPPNPAPPRHTLMLATTPRSGSTYCAIKLWQSGCLGSPLEYLNFWSTGVLCRRLGYVVGEDRFLDDTDILPYWDKVRSLRTSPNGVFSFKMFPTIYREVAQRYPKLLACLGTTHVVYSYRRDLLGQAISYARAQQTQAWFSDASLSKEPSYDFQLIETCRRAIVDQQRFWKQLFARTATRPVLLCYEDLLADPASAVKQLLKTLDIPRDGCPPLDVPELRPQADDINLEWRARFVTDARGFGRRGLKNHVGVAQ